MWIFFIESEDRRGTWPLLSLGFSSGRDTVCGGGLLYSIWTEYVDRSWTVCPGAKVLIWTTGRRTNLFQLEKGVGERLILLKYFQRCFQLFMWTLSSENESFGSRLILTRLGSSVRKLEAWRFCLRRYRREFYIAKLGNWNWQCLMPNRWCIVKSWTTLASSNSKEYLRGVSESNSTKWWEGVLESNARREVPPQSHCFLENPMGLIQSMGLT